VTDAERWFERYAAIWPSFDHKRIHELVHPEAGIFHAGMSEPISGAEEPDHARRAKQLMPDASTEINSWAHSGNVVFVEYTLGGTPIVGRLAGQRVSWDGVGRFTLGGDRVIDAVGRWDTLPLWALLDPAMTRRETFLEASLQQQPATSDRRAPVSSTAG
jgi:SnoaL-like domain